MDGFGVLDLYWAIGVMQVRQSLYALMSSRVMVVGTESMGASLGEATIGADILYDKRNLKLGQLKSCYQTERETSISIYIRSMVRKV